MKPGLRRTLLLVTLMSAGTVLCAETLSGVIHDPQGAVSEEAVLVLQRWSHDVVNKPVADSPTSVKPDSQGHYSINLSPGVYDVLVSCPICEPQVKQLQLKPGRAMQFSPKLKFSRSMQVVE